MSPSRLIAALRTPRSGPRTTGGRRAIAYLEKDPAERPQDALELSRRLTGVEVGAPWTEQQAAEWWQARLPHSEPPAAGGRTVALKMNRLGWEIPASRRVR